MDIGAWLEKQMISSKAYDAEALLGAFEAEMAKGLDGKKSSLAMIPAYVNPGEGVPVGKAAAVIDAGGTNLRIGLATFDERGCISLEHFSKRPMPGRDHEIRADAFYAVLADALEPIQGRFENVGFCFSYPAEILPNYDARLLHWTKEVNIPEMVGTLVGSGLLAALEKRGFGKKKMVLLNDTAAVLLAGVAQGKLFNASSYIGFILGTGTNTAYIEQNHKIGKVTRDNGSMVINVESGGFNALARGPLDLQLDDESDNPGRHVFEKMISGVYMGPLALKLLQKLAGEGLFSERGNIAIREMESLSTIHIDNLASGNGRDSGMLETAYFSDDDRIIMKTVFRNIVERAALFTAVNLAAAVIKSGAGGEPEQPVCINIDGSTYYKTGGLAGQVQQYLKKLLEERALHIRCIQVEESPIVGAAIAGLTTF